MTQPKVQTRQTKMHGHSIYYYYYMYDYMIPVRGMKTHFITGVRFPYTCYRISNEHCPEATGATMGLRLPTSESSDSTSLGLSSLPCGYLRQ